jgi:lipopolysaccharide export system protein LptA
LSNRVANTGFHSSRHPPNWTAAAFSAVVVVALWAGVNCGPSWAQGFTGSSAPGGNRPSAQQKLEGVGKTEKSAVGKLERSSADHHQDKPVPGDSTNEDSQAPFGSLTGSNRGPISIQSDSLGLDYKRNAVSFSGHVHAAQADATLTSNTLNVKYGKDFHQVQHMAADGNVHISQGMRWCSSEHAVMDEQLHTVILTGTPICHDARDQITGTRITVHLDTGKSDVEGAKAVIFPQPSKTRDNEALADHAK